MYRTVLCLTDCDDASNSLRNRLGPGTRLVIANTVLGALTELRKFTPDLIVVQVGLKDESCFDFLRVAQQIVETKHIPMIAASVRHEFHESTEGFIERSCLFFGCRKYLSVNDFHSDGLRFQLVKVMHAATRELAIC